MYSDPVVGKQWNFHLNEIQHPNYARHKMLVFVLLSLLFEIWASDTGPLL